MAYGFAKIGIVSSVPVDVPGVGTAADSLRVDMGNVVEVTLQNAHGHPAEVGLLRYVRPSPSSGAVSNISSPGEWRIWDGAKTIQIEGESTNGGHFDLVSDGNHDVLLLLLSGEPDELLADAQGAYYRGQR